MKKDNKILKSSLSTLMKRFSSTDIVSSLDKEYTTPSNSISLSLIDDNHILESSRVNDADLDEVISNIQEIGFKSPLYVVKREDRYEAIYPRKLYIAATKMGLDNIQCEVLSITDEEAIIYLAKQILISKRPNMVELSLLFNDLSLNYSLKHKDIASIMSLSRSQITNVIKLADLPYQIQRDLVDEKISFGHARTLSTLKESEALKLEKRIIQENLSVRDVEKILFGIKNEKELTKEENLLSKKLNAKVSISPRTINLAFDSEEEKEKFISTLIK